MNEDVSSEFMTDAEINYAEKFTDIKEWVCSAGGYTLLYTANKNGRLYVLKGIKPQYRDNPLYIGLLKKEYDITYRLDHPFLVKVFFFEKIATLGYCIGMEYIDGMTLREWMRGDKINSAMARKWIADLLEGLAYIHKCGVVHKDIKPENLLITHKGNQLKIIDFSLADEEAYRYRKGGRGTAHYAAPELWEEGKATFVSDIYSVGKVIQELGSIKGTGLGACYKKVARKATSFQTGKRFSSVEAMQEELTQSMCRKKIAIGVLVCLFLFSSFFIYWKGNQFSGQETEGEQKLPRPNLQEIYYSCYLKIDSLVGQAEREWAQKIKHPDISGPVYNFERDSAELASRLYSLIAEEYGEYSKAVEVRNSRSWAEQKLWQYLQVHRKKYATVFNQCICDAFKTTDFSQAEKLYKATYGEVARINMEFLNRYKFTH